MAPESTTQKMAWECRNHNQAKLAGISSCALCAGIAGCITILRLRLLENVAADIEMVSVQSLNSEHSDTDIVLVSYRQVLSDTHP